MFTAHQKTDRKPAFLCQGERQRMFEALWTQREGGLPVSPECENGWGSLTWEVWLLSHTLGKLSRNVRESTYRKDRKTNDSEPLTWLPPASCRALYAPPLCAP